MKSTLTDSQMADLLDIVRQQEKTIVELQTTVLGLMRACRDVLGDSFINLIRYHEDELDEETVRGWDSSVRQLEPLSLQLRHSGKPIN